MVETKERRKTPEPLTVIRRPMKPVKVEGLPRNEVKWFSEIKWNGVRALVFLNRQSEILIQSASGRDMTKHFPEFWAGLLELAKEHSLIFDTEIVFGDGKRRTGKIPTIRSIVGAPEIEPENNPTRCSLFVFDLLFQNGENLLYQPLYERKRRLEKLLSKRFQNKYYIRVTPYWTKDHQFVAKEAKRQGYEGIVLKRKDSTYHQGQSRNWLKIKF